MCVKALSVHSCWVILANLDRPPLIPTARDGQPLGKRPHSGTYTIAKVILKIVVIVGVICIALLPATLVRPGGPNTGAVVPEPAPDTVNIDSSAQFNIDRYGSGMLAGKNTKLLVQQPRDLGPDDISPEEMCVHECIQKTFRPPTLSCHPSDTVCKCADSDDSKLGPFLSVGRSCSSSCNYNFEPIADWFVSECQKRNSKSIEPRERLTEASQKQADRFQQQAYHISEDPNAPWRTTISSPGAHEIRSEEETNVRCGKKYQIWGRCKPRYRGNRPAQASPIDAVSRVVVASKPETIQNCSVVGGQCQYNSAVDNQKVRLIVRNIESSGPQPILRNPGDSIEGQRIEKRCKPCKGNELDFLRLDDLVECPCEDEPIKAVYTYSKGGHRCQEGQKLIDGLCRDDAAKPTTPRVKTFLEKLADEQARHGTCTWGTEKNGRCIPDKYGKPEKYGGRMKPDLHRLRVREIWPKDWTPQTEEDCERFRNQGYRYDYCLKEVGHKNVGLKMICGFLILAGASALVFFIITCINRAIRPKAAPFRPKEGVLEDGVDRAGSHWTKVYGDRWARGTPVPDATRQMTESHQGDSLVACEEGDHHGSGEGDGWAKRLLAKRTASQANLKLSIPAPVASMTQLGNGQHGNEEIAPRIPSLQLPNAGLKTVRKMGGLKSEGSALGDEVEGRTQSEVTVLVVEVESMEEAEIHELELEGEQRQETLKGCHDVGDENVI